MVAQLGVEPAEVVQRAGLADPPGVVEHCLVVTPQPHHPGRAWYWHVALAAARARVTMRADAVDTCGERVSTAP
jgi:hypothetical protein